jgi:hypothetical protein
MQAARPAARVLDAERLAALERVGDLIVPGSARAGSALYVDALLARMPEPARRHFLEAIDELGAVAEGGAPALAPHTHSSAFLGLRALVVEAYYSDYVAPGSDARGAWAEIGFDPPAAAFLRKDWSYLGLGS